MLNLVVLLSKKNSCENQLLQLLLRSCCHFLVLYSADPFHLSCTSTSILDPPLLSLCFSQIRCHFFVGTRRFMCSIPFLWSNFFVGVWFQNCRMLLGIDFLLQICGLGVIPLFGHCLVAILGAHFSLFWKEYLHWFRPFFPTVWVLPRMWTKHFFCIHLNMQVFLTMKTMNVFIFGKS